MAGILGSLALVVQLVTYTLSGAAVYSDDYAPTLAAISAHRTDFTLSAGSGAVAMACLLPVALGIFLSFEDDYRPAAALGSLFLALSAALTITAYAFYGNLVGTAADFAAGLAPQAVVIENADVLGDQFAILQFAGLLALGVGLLTLGHLALRTAAFPRVVGWLAVGVGASTVLFNVAPPLVIVGRIAVVASFGWSLWTSSQQEPLAEPEPATA